VSKQILLEDLPLRRFHLRVAFSGTGGQFSDGFVLGIIGIAVSMASGQGNCMKNCLHTMGYEWGL
jgi:putative MFS transporter